MEESSRIYFANKLFAILFQLWLRIRTALFKRTPRITEASRAVCGLDYKNNRMQTCSYAYACANTTIAKKKRLARSRCDLDSAGLMRRYQCKSHVSRGTLASRIRIVDDFRNDHNVSARRNSLLRLGFYTLRTRRVIKCHASVSRLAFYISARLSVYTGCARWIFVLAAIQKSHFFCLFFIFKKI